MRLAARPKFGLPLLCILLGLTAGCSETPASRLSTSSLDAERQAEAVKNAEALRKRGARVWCVPFARTASGIEIRGNARTWWAKAERGYERGHAPRVGAVMAFKPTRRIPLGHVAVVSKVLSPREVLVDQANWHRNQVSLGMAVKDVSSKNDWSAVRVESRPDQFGAIYPVQGFIWAP